MNENYIMLNGKRVDLTDEQIEKLGLKVEKENCFGRVDKQKKYLYINADGIVTPAFDLYWDTDNGLYKVANYCTDEPLIQQRALHETLNRLLWRFSMQNNGDKINWKDLKNKCYILYDNVTKEFRVDYYSPRFKCATEYFYDAKTAKRAIDEIILPFIKDHPEFVW